MCWNADVSLNTFLFSCLALGFVYYTNTYTKYKTPLFDNPIAYAAFMSFVGIQLVEYFLWRNLKNRELNRFLSITAVVLLYLQPFLFLSLTESSIVKTILFYVYSNYVALQAFYYFYLEKIIPYTNVKDGHLVWNIYDKTHRYPTLLKLFYWMNVVWFLVFVYSVYQLGEYLFLAFGVLTIIYCMFRYHTYGQLESVWCWMANSYMIWLVFRILIVLPYYEYSGLC